MLTAKDDIAGLLALGLHEAANMAEIIRAGLNSVDRRQREAAGALGLTPLQTMRTIILPQASAIVSVIGMRDLLTQAQQICAARYLIIEMLLVASIRCLGLTTVASIGQHFIEKRLAPKGRAA